MTAVYSRFNRPELISFVSNDNHIAVVNYLIDTAAHQLRNVGYLAFDILLIRAKQLSQRNVTVVDRQLESFADQRFDQRHHGLLPQIVRARFKTESKDTYSLLACLQDHLNGTLNLQPIAGEN